MNATETLSSNKMTYRVEVAKVFRSGNLAGITVRGGFNVPTFEDGVRDVHHLRAKRDGTDVATGARFRIVDVKLWQIWPDGTAGPCNVWL